jgi:hypothetical protein
VGPAPRRQGRGPARARRALRGHPVPDVRYADDDYFACGDRGVSEWTLTGTTTDGEHVEVRGCDLWT